MRRKVGSRVGWTVGATGIARRARRTAIRECIRTTSRGVAAGWGVGPGVAASVAVGPCLTGAATGIDSRRSTFAAGVARTGVTPISPRIVRSTSRQAGYTPREAGARNVAAGWGVTTTPAGGIGWREIDFASNWGVRPTCTSATRSTPSPRIIAAQNR
jgi:hypothetical protein